MNFLIGGWLTISTLIVLGTGVQQTVEWQPSLSYSLILIEYNESSGNNHSSMLNINNYSIKDEAGDTIRKDSIAIVKHIIDDYENGADTISPSYSTVIALKTERLNYKTPYSVVIRNIRNKNGVIQPPGTSYFYYNGFAPNLVDTPIVNVGDTVNWINRDTTL